MGVDVRTPRDGATARAAAGDATGVGVDRTVVRRGPLDETDVTRVACDRPERATGNDTASPVVSLRVPPVEATVRMARSGPVRASVGRGASMRRTSAVRYEGR